MKLPAVCILYYLQKKYDVSIVNRGKEAGYAGFQIWFPGISTEDTVVIGNADRLEAAYFESGLNHSCLVLSVGKGNFEKMKSANTILQISAEKVTEAEVYNTVKNIFKLFDQWEQQLLSILHDSHSIKNRYRDMLCCSENIMEVPCAIIDVSNRYAAFTDAYYQGYILPNDGNEGYVPWNFVNDTSMRKEWKNILANKGTFYFEFGDSACHIMGKSIFFNKENVGHVGIVVKDETQVDYLEAVLVMLHKYVNELYSQTGTFYYGNSNDSRQIALIKKTLEGKQFSQDVWKRTFQRIGWESQSEFQIAAF
ncbi:MAG: hypothetical protein Q4B03_05655 [Lachnospiraceae bacterium]|nr:hypothetical protein [Lachnospiraceae bacterium]